MDVNEPKFRYQSVDEPPHHIEMAPLTVSEFSFDMQRWCEENMEKYWCWQEAWQEYTFWFESEEDMVKFILKWE